jgi:predicted flap endonuclease-1-like 5' DNA nuclease/predicted  nucleic acid-binding Zn-ribbon protein
MPELTITHIALIVGAVIIGLVLGWVARGNRTVSEKEAINATWQEQLTDKETEHKRLMEQNKSLMEQNSQYQASNKDAKNRASELSDALKEAFERRDELQRQLKDIRSNLESAVSERDQLRSSVDSHRQGEDQHSAALRERDDKIFKLSRELENWQDRLPPLIERYKQRNEEAEQLEQDLEAARERIAALEGMVGSEETRVEPVDPEALGDDLDASNEPIDEDTGEDTDADDIEVDRHSRDNLKLIKGVGPAIEKTLNELGIFRFSQIAEMSDYDIDRVANRLKGFRSRIHREDWMGQARELLLEHSNG